MVGVYIRPPSMTIEQYKDADAQIRAAGIEPKGMLVHTCFGENEGLAIFDVWESKESFEAFAAQIGPILQATGLAANPPDIVPMIAFETA